MWASGGRIRGKTTLMVERAVENRRCVRTTFSLVIILRAWNEMFYVYYTDRHAVRVIWPFRLFLFGFCNFALLDFDILCVHTKPGV